MTEMQVTIGLFIILIVVITPIGWKLLSSLDKGIEVSFSISKKE